MFHFLYHYLRFVLHITSSLFNETEMTKVIYSQSVLHAFTGTVGTYLLKFGRLDRIKCFDSHPLGILYAS
jgi:hypothetical protein